MVALVILVSTKVQIFRFLRLLIWTSVLTKFLFKIVVEMAAILMMIDGRHGVQVAGDIQQRLQESSGRLL